MGWYKNGTIAIAGVTVTGSGTNWTDNKSGIGPGQALLVPAAGTVKMYEILRVDSATKITLASNADAVAAGSAYAILTFYTDSVPDFARRLSAQLSYYQTQMDGWQQIMTSTGSVTLEAPDGTQITLSSFKKLTSDMSNKADLSGGAVAVSQGGTGAKTLADAKKALGSDTVNGMNGGTITGSTRILSATFYITPPADVGGWASSMSFTANDVAKSVMATIYSDNYGAVSIQTGVLQGGGKLNRFETNGNFSTQGNISCVSLTQTSDATKKEKITPIQDPLEKIAQIEGVTFNWLDTGVPSAGVIAQQLMKVLPEAIGSVFDDHDRYEQVEEINEHGETVLVNKLVHARDDSKRSYTVEYAGVVALCVQAIKALNEKVEQLQRAAADRDPG